MNNSKSSNVNSSRPMFMITSLHRVNYSINHETFYFFFALCISNEEIIILSLRNTLQYEQYE